MEAYHCDAEHIYAVTLSAELSGSYNSAVLGRNLYEEEYGEKKIHIFNSRSASVGETLIALKAAECEEKGMSFQEVIETVESYIEEQHTYFVLETLDTLKKNGRLLIIWISIPRTAIPSSTGFTSKIPSNLKPRFSKST